MSNDEKIIELLRKQNELLEEQNDLLRTLIKESTGVEVLRKYRRKGT